MEKLEYLVSLIKYHDSEAMDTLRYQQQNGQYCAQNKITALTQHTNNSLKIISDCSKSMSKTLQQITKAYFFGIINDMLRQSTSGELLTIIGYEEYNALTEQLDILNMLDYLLRFTKASVDSTDEIVQAEILQLNDLALQAFISLSKCTENVVSYYLNLLNQIVNTSDYC